MQPLGGVKVLDFSTLLPGCYTSMILGDLGAAVTKVEAKNRENILKNFPPLVNGVSTCYQVLNRNKKIITLDLKNKNDYAVALDQIRDADIVMEGFRPGVMQRLHLDYSILKKIKPDLIYCSISAYGQTGVYSERAGHDINFMSLAGINKVDPPMLATQMADIGSALYAAIGILTSLYHKQKTGEGQYIDVSMLDTTIALGAANLSKYLAAGLTDERDILSGSSIYRYYRTKDNRYLSVGAIEKKFRHNLAKILEMDDIRMSDQQEIATKIEAKTLQEWRDIFVHEDCCVEPSLNPDEAFALPVALERKIAVEVPATSPQKQVAHPLQYSTFKPRYDFVGGDSEASIHL